MKKSIELIKELGLRPPNDLTPIKLAALFKNQKYAAVNPELIGLKTVGGLKAWLGTDHVGREKTKRRIAIVGKGITFDSGGISIKPSHNMGDMKFDMLGAATVLALRDTLKGFTGRADLFGVCAENTFHQDSARPGDVITYPCGTRVEIENTDAEGRLVLADGILEAKKNNPELIITIATLTGAAKAALGPATAVFSNNDTLVEGFLKVAGECQELAWRLPIWNIHRRDIECPVSADSKGNVVPNPVADIRNQGTMAGASTAAAFLERFVGDTPWIHLDIAGSAYKNRKPTGAMLKSLTKFILNKDFLGETTE